jgi:hypothetical protein
MDEVGLHDGNDFAGSRVSNNQWIQGLRFATERHDEAPSRPTHFSREYQQFFFCAFLLGRSSSLVAGKSEKGQEQ